MLRALAACTVSNTGQEHNGVLGLARNEHTTIVHFRGGVKPCQCMSTARWCHTRTDVPFGIALVTTDVPGCLTRLGNAYHVHEFWYRVPLCPVLPPLLCALLL